MSLFYIKQAPPNFFFFKKKQKKPLTHIFQMLAEFLFLLPSLFSIAHVSCQTTNLNSTARSAPPTAEVVANFSSSNVGPGGFTPGVPYVTAGSYYRPSGVSDIKYNGGYTLKGNSNLYGIYYGTNNYFDGEHGQAGSPTGDCTVSSSSMYNQSFTGAMDEFLTYFGKSTIPQWKTIMAYTGIGELTFVKSVRIR